MASPSSGVFSRAEPPRCGSTEDAFDPPALSPDFRASLRRRMRSEAPRLWPEALPDFVHVASCLLATVVCAIVLPFGAGPVLAIGVLVTAATYVLILAARLWLEA